MVKKKNLDRDSLHKCVSGGLFNLELKGETLIAVHNALSFTLSHRDLYAEDIEVCPSCIEEMFELRKNVSQILEYSNIYDKNKDKLVN